MWEKMSRSCCEGNSAEHPLQSGWCHWDPLKAREVAERPTVRAPPHGGRVALLYSITIGTMFSCPLNMKLRLIFGKFAIYFTNTYMYFHRAQKCHWLFSFIYLPFTSLPSKRRADHSWCLPFSSWRCWEADWSPQDTTRSVPSAGPLSS